MSTIKQALDALNEMTSGCVASVAMPLGATQQRENPSIYPATSQVKEAETEVEEEESPNDFGLWRNSALIGKEQKAKRQSAKKKVTESTKSSRLTWSDIDESISIDDKMYIFEQYYTDKKIFESIDEDKKDYFVSLFKMSEDPIKNKTYYIAPLALANNRIIVVDTPQSAKFLNSDGESVIFKTDSGEKKYPSKIIRDISIFNTFIFSSIDDYDKFRTALYLKFNTKLPKISEKSTNEGIGPDKNDPWEKGWYAGHHPNLEDSYNPYEKGSADYKQWQDGYDEAQAQPNHYNEDVAESKHKKIPNLRRVGEPLKSDEDAISRLSAGDRIFRFHDMDGRPEEVHSVDDLKGYTYDQLLAVPANLNEYDEGIKSNNPQGIPEGEDLVWDDPDLVTMRKMQAAKKKKMAVVKPKDEIGFRISDIGPGGREHNVKTDAAWDKRAKSTKGVTEESERLSRLKAAKAQGKSIGQAYSDLKDLKGTAGNSTERAAKLKAARAQGKSISQAYSSLDDKKAVAEGEIEQQYGDTKPWAYWGYPERVAKKLYQIHKGQPIDKSAIVQLWKQDGPDRMTKFMLKPDVSAILSAYEQMSNEGPLFKEGEEQGVAEGRAWHSTPQSAMIGINGNKTMAKSASDSEYSDKSFTYQGHTIKFTPTKREIYKGGDLLHSKDGDYSNPTKRHLSVAHADVGRLMAKREDVAEGGKSPSPGWMLRQDPELAKKVKDATAGYKDLKKYAGKDIPKKDVKEQNWSRDPWREKYFGPTAGAMKKIFKITVQDGESNLKAFNVKAETEQQAREIIEKHAPDSTIKKIKFVKNLMTEQDITEAERNEMDTPEFQDALARMRARHSKDEWSVEKSRELAKKLASRVLKSEKKIDSMIDKESAINEVAPPDQEEWIKKNKARFIDQYGKKKGERILYATAWKRSKTNETAAPQDFRVGQHAEYQSKNKNYPPFPVIITAIDGEHIEFRSATGKPIPGTGEVEWSADPGWQVLTPSRSYDPNALVAATSRESAEPQGQQIDEEGKGLWANIHAKRKRIKAGSGERMRKPGSAGAPSNADFKASRTTEGTDRDFDGEYNDEAGMARSNLHTIARAAEGLLDTIGDRDNLPEWVQEKIAKVEGMMVSAWDYLQSQEEQGIDPKIAESFNLEEELQKLDDAKYQGRTVPLNKPMKGDVKKSKVYVKDPKTGNVKKVNFGQKGVKIKKNNPGRRKSFRARHGCDNPGPKTKAKYWSCKAW